MTPLMNAWRIGCRLRKRMAYPGYTIEDARNEFNKGESTLSMCLRLRNQYSRKDIRALEALDIPLRAVQIVASVKDVVLRASLLVSYSQRRIDIDELLEDVKGINAQVKKGKGERSNG